MFVLKSFLVFTVFTLFLWGCKSTKTTTETNSSTHQTDEMKAEKDPFEEIKKNILGIWKWEKTECCGRMMQTIYPNENIPAYDYHFKAENQLDRINTGGNRQPMRYEIHSTEIYPDRPFISLSTEQNRPALVEIRGDTLIINYGYMDLQTEYYIRKQ